MKPAYTRRELLAVMGAGAVLPHFPARAAGAKPVRGIFPIVATPYTLKNEVDYEDLAREVEFMDRCGAHGMVWPQGASECTFLTKEERLRGMRVLAKAAKGKTPALVLGIQGPNLKAALEYIAVAEELAPDAIIAMPPTEAKSLDDYRNYYRTLIPLAKRPFFIQTTSGAKDVDPTVEFIIELSKEFPNFGYVKEEHSPVFERIAKLVASRPVIKGVFSGPVGTYEMRLGCDGSMPAAPYPDVDAQIWNLYQAGQLAKAQEIYCNTLLMTNTAQQITGTRQYIMKKRGVFKTTMSRREKFTLTPEAIKEIDFNFEALKPYLKV